MLILVSTLKPAPAAGGINWNAATAIGTLILAAVTLLTLAYAIRTTTRERKQAAKDREDAETRLDSERKAGDQRLKDERDHAAEVRRRDRQIDRISVLAARVAEMQAYLDEVPGAALRAGWGRNSPSVQSRSMVGEEALTALSSLRHGAWTEAPLLGTGGAAEQAAGRYLELLILVDDAARADTFSDRDKESMRNYARWVLISLRMLAEDETVPQISKGHPESPGSPGEDDSVWNPEPFPPGWWDMELADSPEHWRGAPEPGPAG